MPVTTLDTNFLAHIAKLEDVSSSAAEAVTEAGQREWMNPPLNGWGGEPRDVVGLNSAFDRTDLNQQYENVIGDTTQESTVGEAMVTKLQVDYVAAMERAYRTRHCSSVRARVHAASRRKGLGSTSGPFTGSVVLWLQRLLQAAHDT